jgi:hypothetical protein
MMARNEKNSGFFRNAFERMVEARMRQANAFVAAHAYLHEDRAFDVFGEKRPIRK